MKLIMILSVFLLSFFLQSTSCVQHEDYSKASWKGMDEQHDLVFFFKKGITYEQKQQFQIEVLSRERPDGRGRDHPDGVVDIISGTIVNNHDGGIVNFSENASLEQRETLRKAIADSTFVDKVYENVVPKEEAGSGLRYCNSLHFIVK